MLRNQIMIIVIPFSILPTDYITSCFYHFGVLTVPCPKGEFFKDEKCTVCPLNEYQDSEGQTSCKKCATGKFTAATRSTSSEDCQGRLIGNLFFKLL